MSYNLNTVIDVRDFFTINSEVLVKQLTNKKYSVETAKQEVDLSLIYDSDDEARLIKRYTFIKAKKHNYDLQAKYQWFLRGISREGKRATLRKLFKSIKGELSTNVLFETFKLKFNDSGKKLMKYFFLKNKNLQKCFILLEGDFVFYDYYQIYDCIFNETIDNSNCFLYETYGISYITYKELTSTYFINMEKSVNNEGMLNVSSFYPIRVFGDSNNSLDVKNFKISKHLTINIKNLKNFINNDFVAYDNNGIFYSKENAKILKKSMPQCDSGMLRFEVNNILNSELLTFTLKDKVLKFKKFKNFKKKKFKKNNITFSVLLKKKNIYKKKIKLLRKFFIKNKIKGNVRLIKNISNYRNIKRDFRNLPEGSINKNLRRKIFKVNVKLNRLHKLKKLLKFYTCNLISKNLYNKLTTNSLKFKQIQIFFSKKLGSSNYYNLDKNSKKYINNNLFRLFKSQKYLYKLKSMSKYLSSKSNTIAKKQHFFKKIVRSETLVQEFSSKIRNLRKIKLFQNKQSKLNVVYFNKLNRVNIVKTGEFCINNYLFLNKHAIESYLLQFFNNKKFIKDTNKKMQYKKRIKIKKNSTFFFNFRNKKLTVFKNARQAH
jgi:hypothetical protein